MVHRTSLVTLTDDRQEGETRSEKNQEKRTSVGHSASLSETSLLDRTIA